MQQAEKFIFIIVTVDLDNYVYIRLVVFKSTTPRADKSHVNDLCVHSALLQNLFGVKADNILNIRRIIHARQGIEHFVSLCAELFNNR